MASKEDAKEAVKGIAKDYGFVDDEIMNRIEQWDPDVRRVIEESMLAKDKKAAHSIKTLAKNIYASDARFVFELLQNADDNRFRHARENDALPFISFQVHPDRIVVECNEDGFSKNDLSAVCSVGESTKTTSHGYIGAKGIGFKSVFIAAWKVHILSGNFSFYFKHEKGDLGLGMVLPVWQDTDDDLPKGLTRMTLYLHNKGDPQESKHLRQIIFKQLNDLQQTCLLFLQNLKQIRVAFYNEDGGLKNSKDFRVGKTCGHNVSIETALTGTNGETTEEDKYYHVTRHMATDLARSDNREPPDTEEARRASSRAEVVLAFPLTSDAKPLIEQQDIFAFLPVRESSFKFLIQSDFDTSASRQDISTSSRRNIDLLDGIAKAFVKAVLQFTEHPGLCYTWPSFLPASEKNASTFWSDLSPKIKRRICKKPILKSRRGKMLRKIDDVVLLCSDFQDNEGNPLFEDSLLDPFISDEYPQASCEILEYYGLRKMSYEQLLVMLNDDLSNPASWMKSASSSEDWHSAVAHFFLKCSPISKLKSFELLPLRSGAWVSANSGSVFLPTTGGVPIPPGIDFRILDPAAVANKNRKKLFTQIGVTEPSISRVRESILNEYDFPNRRVSMVDSRAHLHYLYLTHQSKQPLYELKNISFYSKDDDYYKPHMKDFYLPSLHPYGPEVLLGRTDSAPGFRDSIVNPAYLEDKPTPTDSMHPSWERWLYVYANVRERLRIVSDDWESLTKAWYHVAEHHPKKLLGLLQYLWKYEEFRLSIRCSDAVKEEIENTNANMLCRLDLPHSCAIRETFLPLPHLEQQCQRFMEESEHFPFLELEGATSASVEELSTKWMFLHTVFSVGKEDNIEFLLKILYWIRKANTSASSVAQHQRLLDLYVAIEGKHLGAMNKKDEKANIQHLFHFHGYVFVPAGNGHEARWAEPWECLWVAPPDMVSKYSLKHLYSPMLGATSKKHLSNFFRQTLSIPNATWNDLTAELEELKDGDCEDFDHILGLYKTLSQMRIIDSRDMLRKIFAEKGLIFVVTNGQSGWYKVSECLWSSTTNIRGKVTLNDHYEDLKDFFIDTLGVRTLTLQMVYDELLQANAHKTIDEVKSAIWSFNALLQTEIDTVDPMPLLKSPVFPIVYPGGAKALRSADSEFAIVDRKYIASRFKDRIKLLDYSLEDVQHLKPFFEWANLSHRCLSVSVKEITSVSEEISRPTSVPNFNLKLKAHALLRIAATYSSPRYEADATGLYQLLRTVDIIATNGISLVLSISQDGKAVEVEEARGNLHISENSSEVTVYVASGKKAQELGLTSFLPEYLADWIMRNPITLIREKSDSTIVTVISMLLHAGPSNIDPLLDRQGIIHVPIPNEDPIHDDDDDNDGDDDDDDAVSSQRSTTPDASTSRRLTRSSETPRTPSTDTNDESSTISSRQVVSRQSRMAYDSAVPTHSRFPPVYTRSPGPSAEDGPYRMLLSRVVLAARRATFPLKGAFDMADLIAALPGEEASRFDGFDGLNVGIRFRSDSQLERDKKIGAAGELYAFELLSGLNPSLSGWSRANWQSTIRQYVTIHPDYADMNAWRGRETADLTYEDTNGDLTALLIDDGYFDSEEWEDARPKYYIEVKTTTGPCDTPFYMSKHQYQRMRDIHNRAGRSEVYMILRVFEIEGDSIGMTVYLDPEQLRLDERLVFTGETWSVIPG